VNFSSSSTNGDLETLARAAQILHSRTSCGKGTAKSSPKKFEEKSLQFIQKRQILDGEALTRATRSNAEGEPFSKLYRGLRHKINVFKTSLKSLLSNYLFADVVYIYD